MQCFSDFVFITHRKRAADFPTIGYSATPEEQEAYRLRPLPFWGVAQAIERIELLLAVRPAGAELGAFLPVIAEPLDRDRRRRATVASTLVASLELARRGTVSVEQDAPWERMSLQRVASAKTPSPA